ncbi:MAG TPA: alkaline phosphatase family protein [Bacteroidota bacterium]|nr:alkaline phosphatase family protein [Bacteroidota bacterium]
MKPRRSCVLLFLDGVGIGIPDSATNPFFRPGLECLPALCGGRFPDLSDPVRRLPGATVIPIDATLGVDGLPQSGTGQTSLYTGLNAAALIGRHFGPYPYSTLRPMLARENIFRKVIGSGRRALFANAYPPQYFRYIAEHPGRMTATALAWQSTGLPFNGPEELRKGEGVSADITNARWPKLGFPDMPHVSPHEAGRVLGRLSESFDLVLFEYYYTDHAGHSRSGAEASAVLGSVDGLLSGILAGIDPQRTLVLVTSDHGNMEDLSTKSHTRNPVPFIAAGFRHDRVTEGLRDLTGVLPAIMRYLEE